MKKGTMALQKGIDEEEQAIEHAKQMKQELDIEDKKEESAQNIPQAPQTAPEPLQNTPEGEKRSYEANTKPQKQSFSFRAEQSKIENWKLYAETVGGDIGALWTAAIEEYISNHKLTKDQQAIYDLKKKVAEMQKKQK